MKVKNIIRVIFLVTINSLLLIAKSDDEFCQVKNKLSNKYAVSSSAHEFVLYVIFCNPNDEYPIELWIERTKSEDWSALDFYDIAKEIKEIYPIANSYLKDLKVKEMNIVIKRLEHMFDVAKRGLLMESKNWKSRYADVLNKHIIGIRRAGISDLFPKKLSHSTTNCPDKLGDLSGYHYCQTELSIPTDEETKNMKDIFRTMEEGIAKYIDEQGGNYELIKRFKISQGHSSWGGLCKEVKYYFQKQRNFRYDAYYGGLTNHTTSSEVEKNLETTIPVWHAYTQEFLKCTDFFHNDKEKEQVCLTRFDGLSTFSNAREVIDSRYRIQRAVYDSYTLFNYFYTNGYRNQIISMQLVDYIQIFDCYLLEGYSDVEGKETEFIALVGPEMDTFLGGGANFNPDESFMPAEHVKEVVTKILLENWCSADNSISLEEAKKKATISFDEWCLTHTCPSGKKYF